MSFLPPATPPARANRQRSIGSAITLVDKIAPFAEHNLRRLLSGEGTDWYLNGHAIAQSLCPGDPDRGAAVLAALSPQLDWQRNVEVAFALVRDPDRNPGVLGRSYTNALSALQTTAAPLSVLSGRKVKSFGYNLAYPTTSYHVTIDRHMIDAIVGVKGYCTTRHAKILERPGVYQYFAALVRSVARGTGHLPSEVQASVWTNWKSLNLKDGDTL